MSHNNAIPKAFLMIGGSKVYPIKRQVTRIGRACENDLILDYPQISRQHAELRYTQDSFKIIDLDSTGGTFVNGIKIDQYELNKGDVITLVDLHLIFGQDEVPELTPTTEYQNPNNKKPASQATQTLPLKSLIKNHRGVSY